MKGDETAADVLRRRLRRDLTKAMKAGRFEKVSALRLLMAAVDNAEAVTAVELPATEASLHVAGAVRGAGSTEAVRREISPEDLGGLLHMGTDGLRERAANYETFGRTDDARRLWAQAEVMERYREPEAGGLAF
jgi:uncharacterized protein